MRVQVSEGGEIVGAGGVEERYHGCLRWEHHLGNASVSIDY